MHPTDLTPFSPPGTDEYAAACAAFQLAAPVDPAGAFTARSVGDVVRAVATARRAGLPLRVHTTGHGMGRAAPVAGALLLRPLIDAPVRVDPVARTARIPAGKRWSDVLPAAVAHGLTAAHGSSATVGAVGYLLNGGISFYGRRFGVAANLVRSITLVTAAGEVVVASAAAHPDLFWALRGGGGGFGVVVEVEVALVPMHRVVTGMAVWDAAGAATAGPAWQRWAETAPREVTTSLRLLNVPPLPTVPPALAGRRILVLDGAVAAETPADVERAEKVTAEMLAALPEPEFSTWAPAGPETLPLTHMDPAEPIPFRSDTLLLRSLPEAGWAALLDAAGRSELLSVELRQLGGAFAEPAPDGGAFQRVGAPLLYWACGLPGERTEADLAAVRAALAPYATGFTAPTFADHFGQPQRTYDEAARARVERVRRDVDPGGLFAGDVAAIRDR
ncbi:FAD-binding oxidoreductase [Catenuloplanes indicus]|uniref:FAD/FMN-containing dehydrogenase n=1 Tax=Catenuloplanes indicus TaxID=137267 RepID=A0AAE4B215_9ACTN|nr:FAD-dependent oxidoreductase [Catenuloplanes indicus]MDQ0371224.1 FAD/FMN-containing dehydrogenase [Catenuloplanes indicus]